MSLEKQLKLCRKKRSQQFHNSLLFINHGLSTSELSQIRLSFYRLGLNLDWLPLQKFSTISKRIHEGSLYGNMLLLRNRSVLAGPTGLDHVYSRIVTSILSPKTKHQLNPFKSVYSVALKKSVSSIDAPQKKIPTNLLPWDNLSSGSLGLDHSDIELSLMYKWMSSTGTDPLELFFTKLAQKRINFVGSAKQEKSGLCISYPSRTESVLSRLDVKGVDSLNIYRMWGSSNSMFIHFDSWFSLKPHWILWL